MVMDWKRLPAYFLPPPEFYRIAPAALLRPQRSVPMLYESGKLSLDDMIQLKHSTHEEAADRLLGDLLKAAETFGSARAKEAAAELKAWDRNTEAGSRGAVLFPRWFAQMQANPFARMWEEGAPHDTPAGLKDPEAALKALEAAADEVTKQYGALDVAWGDANRFHIGNVDLPANGGSGTLGIFRVIQFARQENGKAYANAGDSFVAAVEFSNPLKARALLSYGNSSEPDSKHHGDQLELLSRKELRPVWRTRSEIEKNLERRELP